MTARFAVGVVVGGLLALTPFILPAVLVVGAWATLTAVGTLLVLAAVHCRMDANRGGANGAS